MIRWEFCSKDWTKFTIPIDFWTETDKSINLKDARKSERDREKDRKKE